MASTRAIKSLYAISTISGTKQMRTCRLVMVAVYGPLKLIMSWGNVASVFQGELTKTCVFANYAAHDC